MSLLVNQLLLRPYWWQLKYAYTLKKTSLDRSELQKMNYLVLQVSLRNPTQIGVLFLSWRTKNICIASEVFPCLSSNKEHTLASGVPKLQTQILGVTVRTKCSVEHVKTKEFFTAPIFSPCWPDGACQARTACSWWARIPCNIWWESAFSRPLKMWADIKATSGLPHPELYWRWRVVESW